MFKEQNMKKNKLKLLKKNLKNYAIILNKKNKLEIKMLKNL